MIDYMLTGHKCREISRATTAAEGREFWLGELTEPYKDYPETHCLHIKTPEKEVVFGFNSGDALIFMTFAVTILNYDMSKGYLLNQVRRFRAKSGTEKEIKKFDHSPFMTCWCQPSKVKGKRNVMLHHDMYCYLERVYLKKNDRKCICGGREIKKEDHTGARGESNE